MMPTAVFPSATQRQMSHRVRLGMLTPSSNTVLEPVCAAMLSSLPEVSLHFGRVRVTEISLEAAALDQFSREAMLKAALLLSDAKVNAICWNGTSAGWLGLDRDRDFCSAISHTTGVPVTSSVLAMFDALRDAGHDKVGLVTPYIDAVQSQIVENFTSEGLRVVAERHLDLSENFAFAEVSDDTIVAMVRDVAASKPDAVLVLCTNVAGAPLVEQLEAELDVAILDSVATAVWGSLRATGVDPTRVKGWGRLFSGLAARRNRAPPDDLLEADPG